MAYLVPSDLTQLALSGGAHGPELDTLERLKRELGPQFHVYHGVHWARSYRHYSHFGELDFVIVNNAGAVLVIEQKNGLLEEGEAGLAKRYADGSKSIVRQMHRSIDAIREKYKYSHAGSDRLELDYLLYCPDHRVANVNAAGIDAGRIVDAMRAPQLSQVIAETLGTGGEEPDERAVPVRDFFAQTFDVMPDVGTCIASQEARYTRLTGGLPEVVDNIDMTPFRLRVQATAGSGKTQLALQQFNRAVAAGRRPLYVCFNRPLADRFREVARPEGTADTFYGLIHHFLESVGEKVDFDRVNGTDGAFWQGLQERVIASDIGDDARYDLVVVDEGQDFSTEWYQFLLLFARPQYDLLWLEDEAQNIRGNSPRELDGAIGYRADVNYRTPWTIARYIRDKLGIDFRCGNDLLGLGVGEHTYEEPGDQRSIVEGIVRNLVAQGFRYEDIVILSMHGVGKSGLGELDAIAGVPVRRFTGGYDDSNNQVYTDGKLYFETVYRFKGQQAPVVIVTDIDGRAHDPEQYKATLFSAMTRATVRLEVLNGVTAETSARTTRAGA